MDQVRVGKFIAECRKNNHLTQMQLAEKLGITDRAVSKWENGKAMPDSAIMLELCDVLHITVNDLLNGEIVSPEQYNQKLEAQLLEAVKGKQESDKLLLRIALGIDIFTTVLSFVCGMICAALDFNWLAWTTFGLTLGFFMLCIFLYGRIYEKAGYYKCAKCGQAYVPTKKAMRFALGLSYRKMYFRCAHCQKRAWHKKVLTKD